jgi:hypothetical protein
LSHTFFFPDLMQVNFFPATTWVAPTFVHVAPAATFGAAIAGD